MFFLPVRTVSCHMKVFSRTMLPEMATECLSRMANNETIHKIYVSVDDEVELGYQVSLSTNHCCCVHVITASVRQNNPGLSWLVQYFQAGTSDVVTPVISKTVCSESDIKFNDP